MFQVIRTRLALSLAVIAIATMSVAPAYAAPASGRGAPSQAPQAPQAPQAVVFQPDLRVNSSLNASYVAFNDTWIYHFTVTNIGVADSGAIALKGICRYSDPHEKLSTQTVLATVVGGLKANHSTSVDVVCPHTTQINDGAMLSAGTQNDLDPSNNGATAY
jgi:hypothetical protein